MNYTLDDLKKQIISLDFSKKDEISELNLNELKEYTSKRIEYTSGEIDNELSILNTSVETLYSRHYNLVSNTLPVLISTGNLLKRIYEDLKKL
ncbi:hypothetical protein MTP09_06275 [Chryseobacterium suipulveris]|uniref:Uncharacterized protein n=1 Tax=Chryseobacterium suipulveris TaxID=2929800 RepID=A0ABY4BVP6_9FLAO|nr:hypothetical protein [Chryseobacterium suipulveris]UOE42242.1 hypothetical protein MTP09_06275 [Chryseobacterium suipulveris]